MYLYQSEMHIHEVSSWKVKRKYGYCLWMKLSLEDAQDVLKPKNKHLHRLHHVSLKLVFHSEVQDGSLVCVWVWKRPVRRKLMPWRAQPHPPCIVSTASPHPIAISLPTFIKKWRPDSVQCLYCINPVLPTQKQLRISTIFESRLDPHDGKTSPRRFGSVAAGSETGKGCGCHGDDCPEITSVERPTMHCSRRRVLMVAVLTLQKKRPSFVFLARFLV